MISVLFWPTHHHLPFCFPPKFPGVLSEWFSHFTNWNHLGIKRFFFSASRKILMCSKIWETQLYMLSALVFSHLAWKDRPVLSYSSLKKKKMLLHLQWIQTHSSLIRCLFWEGSHHHARCFSAELAYSLSSPLNFFLIFLFILSRLRNYYRSTVIPQSFQLLFKFLSLAIVGICLPV